MEQQYWFPEIGNSLKNSKEMAEGEVNKEDMYDNVRRVFKANERGLEALLKNGNRGMLLCCG